MPSPFPGMDPYLEDPAFWPDFHSTFINYWREAIADLLPEDYDAGIGERVYLVEVDPYVQKLISPDVSVDDAKERIGTKAVSAGVATLEPVTIPLTLLDGLRQGYIEILHRPERRLVAVLELLSPANKELPHRLDYLAKREALLHQDVHLVELDLLLSGKRLPMGRPLPPGDCYYFVSRAEQRYDCQVYAWTLQAPLPRLPVPLRPPDADVLIDLAVVFTTAYERGRYGRRLRYDAACPAPLTRQQRSWVKKVLK